MTALVIIPVTEPAGVQTTVGAAGLVTEPGTVTVLLEGAVERSVVIGDLVIELVTGAECRRW